MVLLQAYKRAPFTHQTSAESFGACDNNKNHTITSHEIMSSKRSTMNGRLFEAAQTGKGGVLFELLKEHPLVLHAIIPLTSVETPLHVASLAGQLNFVKEMIIMKPEFAGKLNQDGFSPKHLASTNGYLEIVRELMKVDSSRRRLSSGDGRTPLHLACSFQW
ncbi:hypothetical protein Syun_018650 [Stephania yunnanensis]|uniref:Uncharacterized protein n=1 Tax=Stephania yunnanensis TaxID=152371 RepID=A0AAP0ISM1_9MAGN